MSNNKSKNNGLLLTRICQAAFILSWITVLSIAIGIRVDGTFIPFSYAIAPTIICVVALLLSLTACTNEKNAHLIGLISILCLIHDLG